MIKCEIATIRWRAILRITGWLMLLEALMLLVPMAVCLLYGERDYMAFLQAAGLCGAIGGLLTYTNNRSDEELLKRESYLLTVFIWVIFSLFGMLPFMLSAHPLGVSDAFFEAMSGFTTTGATAFCDLDSQSHGILFWRSEMQWLGGLGIIIFLIALLPSLNKSGGIYMFNTEATGITHDKLHPRVRQTAMSLWHVYIALTGLLIVLLWMGPMTLFESVCTALSTLSTGGFCVRSTGIGSWHSNYVKIVLTAFMFVGGINFSLLYLLIKGKVRDFWHNDVLRMYVKVVAAIYLVFLIMLVCQGRTENIADLFIDPIFLIVSAITSTGFATCNYEVWGPMAMLLIMMLMFSGACAGSTTGGAKIDRLLFTSKNLRNETILSLYPGRVMTVNVNNKILFPEQITRITAFLSIYMIIVVIATLILAAFGIGFSDAIFAASSCMGNSGLGYGLTGADGSFAAIPNLDKWMLSAVMLLGRLEIFSVLVLFSSAFWRR